MYTLAIYLYMLAAHIAALFGNRKARQMVRGQRATWRLLREKIAPGEAPVWFHAASLGEFEQGRPLMERLRREQPEQKILLTFFSPSGYEVRKNYEGADVVCYLPFDTWLNARKFVRLAHPSKAFFIKYEFWANYLRCLQRRGIPAYSVSSIFRPGQIFFRRFHFGYAAVLRRITHFFVQNEASRQLLRERGYDNLSVVGDTRFDRVIDIRRGAKPLPLVERFAAGTTPVFVVGSSWEPDEDVYLDYFQHHDWKLIIATHVVSPERVEKLSRRLEGLGYSVCRYSELSQRSDAAATAAAAPRSALLLDCYGLLSSVYRYATVAYVGGGFGVGIHNVPEAAVYGVPVVIGPNNKKFREAQALLQNGGCREVSNAADFASLMDTFSAHHHQLSAAGQAAAAYIRDNAGAADAIFAAVLSSAEKTR